MKLFSSVRFVAVLLVAFAAIAHAAHHCGAKDIDENGIEYCPILCVQDTECYCPTGGEVRCKRCPTDNGSANKDEDVCYCIGDDVKNDDGLECNPLKPWGPAKVKEEEKTEAPTTDAPTTDAPVTTAAVAETEPVVADTTVPSETATSEAKGCTGSWVNCNKVALGLISAVAVLGIIILTVICVKCFR